MAGAGTVLDLRQLEVAAESGATFIVTPTVDPQVIRRAREYGMGTVIGAFTPTEIEQAACCGADIVKIFPAGFYGAAQIKPSALPARTPKRRGV